jgi:hypothetical protein
MEYMQFKKTLELISQKVFPTQPVHLAFVGLLKESILPLLKSKGDQRSVHSKVLKTLLNSLDKPDMI